MKFPRVARLDDSDERVYAPAARIGELAVPGTFVFTLSDEDPEALSGKPMQAFRTGFLGLESFGWTTVVRIAEIPEDEFEGAIRALARYLVRDFGAPSLEAALPVARQEAEYAASLCEYEPGTLLTLERHADDEGIHESFRHIRQSQAVADWQGQQGGGLRVWDLLDERKA